jgi:hypothetical protein
MPTTITRRQSVNTLGGPSMARIAKKERGWRSLKRLYNDDEEEKKYAAMKKRWNPLENYERAVVTAGLLVS